MDRDAPIGDANALGLGSHTLAVQSDSLPLPWVPATEIICINVTPRDASHIEIGATRDRLGAGSEGAVDPK